MLQKSIIMPIILLISFFQNGYTEEWYRGNVHMHSYWSDGAAFPEEAVQLYRDNGYQFVCLSDHNVFQNNSDRWATVGKKKMKLELVNRFSHRFPGFFIDRKVTENNDQIRLKTWDEIAETLCVPGEFLMIPGYEHTTRSQATEDKHEVHLNVVGTRQIVPVISAATAKETVQQNVNALESMLVKSHENDNAFIMLNHPNWRYFDITPEDVIQESRIQFFELSNASSTWTPHEKSCNNEKLWDVVNTYRIAHEEPVLWGVGTDDTHNYDHGYAYPSHFGAAWVMVRAAELSQNAIIQAMKRGDFYTSTGITLDELDWNSKTRMLQIRIHPELEEHYTIEFIGTREGTPITGNSIEDPATEDGKPARIFTEYSPAIGEVLLRIEGTEATCELPENYLYIRAKITSDTAPNWRTRGKPEQKTAWTQPYTHRPCDLRD